MAAAAIALDRFTPVVVLDVLGCWVLAAALLAGHHLSQVPAMGSPRPLRNLACLLGFGAVGLAVVVSYNVQVAGPNAEAGTVSGSAQPSAGPQSQQQGTTNITVHCENNEDGRRLRARR
jgi:hypothetical protein